LIEEAITSSQLEGAATTRQDAKEMLRTGREPRDHSERMILNNYFAMSRIRELVDRPLTPDLVLEIHRTVTDGTLSNPEHSGRLQDDQSQRVSVRDEEDELLHQPPHVSELPSRLSALCEFANDTSGSPYMPPVLRALTIHFMMGYDHYFEDGNGRTARALFYWSMLRQGYWLTEFLSVSRILRKAPSLYAQSFLLTEGDEGDLTHFFVYHLGVIERAIRELHSYLAAKAEEVRDVQARLRGMPGDFNHRQLAVVEHAARNSGAVFTIKSHRSSHRIAVETARQDLRGLEHKGLLEQIKVGRQYVWRAVPHLVEHL
jgi:Fic family protein